MSRGLALLTSSFVLVLSASSQALADPIPGPIVLSTAYPSVTTEHGKELIFPIELVNRSGTFQDLGLEIADAPANWTVLLRDKGLSVRRAIVPPDKPLALELSIKPPQNAEPKEYPVLIRAISSGRATLAELRVSVALAKAAGTSLRLTTQFPQVRGQAGSSFTFKADLANEAPRDRDITLAAEAPQGWEVLFKPSFETKQVSTLRVKGGSTQGVDIDITPPQKVEAGEYRIVVQAATDGERAELPLQLVVVGQGRMSLSTPTGQLSTKATIDQETRVTLAVKNEGTAPLRGVTLSSFPPSGWTVRFEPERIEELAPDRTEQVTMAIKPSSRALTGDYMLSVTASGTGASASKDIRVTVEPPTAWGIAALLAIAAILGGMGTMFWKLSRR